MTGHEKDQLVALKGIHQQLKRIADHYEEATTQQNEDIVNLRNDLTSAIYAANHRPGA